ncbi:LrgB family protein [Marinicella meishanensis]|uniref:LrgB family protein n=1 Tax=Marinicella meishanensis TaxID=2873263 RepID=UPI001CBFF876|nr:LrgB family protein [Marinicella sp. NBU2979]
MTVDWSSWFPANPLWGVLLTVGVYFLANRLFQKARQTPLLHPVLVSVLVIIGLLWWWELDYAAYMSGGQLIHFLLGPATVALAWPLYQSWPTFKRCLWPVLVAVTCGILVGATSAIYLAAWLGASELTQLSLAPKSVTTPVAIVVSEQLGGLPALTAGFVIITGVVGAMFGAQIFRWMGVDDPRVSGLAMGVSAHGVGTARAWQLDHTMGAYSGLGMGVAAVMVAFVLPPWLWLLGWL